MSVKGRNPTPAKPTRGATASAKASAGRPAPEKSPPTRPVSDRPTGRHAARYTSRNTSAKPTPSQQRATRRAAEVAEAARRERRRRLIRVLAPVAVVLVIVIALVAVKLGSNGNKPKSGAKTVTAAAAVVAQVTHVPAATLNTVGVGSVTTPPKTITGSALTAGGKPAVLYIGGEFCPYCAAERWGVAVALSRFGTWTGLGQTTSSPSDVFPSTASLSFHGATLTSSTIAFPGKEIYSNQVKGSSYAKLDTLTAAETATRKKYDQNESIPFIDIGGKYAISGSSFSPQVLHGLTHAQIAAALSDPASPVAKGIDGTANLVTAAICQSTAQKPVNVCSSAGVQAATARLTAGS